ncbi:MAG: hypothetical protein OSB70_04870 [Myxococcota bacterium]|nr:hypothetical protein [Myxococcota bacterium]
MNRVNDMVRDDDPAEAGLLGCLRDLAEVLGLAIRDGDTEIQTFSPTERDEGLKTPSIAC